MEKNDETQPYNAKRLQPPSQPSLSSDPTVFPAKAMTSKLSLQ